METEVRRRPRVVELIKTLPVNQNELARKMGFSPYTFHMKMKGTDERYRFSENEVNIMKAYLKKMAEEIEKL